MRTYKKIDGKMYVQKGIFKKTWVPLVEHIKEEHHKIYEVAKEDIENLDEL